MQIFTRSIAVPSGVSLGGYARPNNRATQGGHLEVNGLVMPDFATGKSYQLCAVDALYPGDLARFPDLTEGTPLFAASHTHSAPMLDSSKPRLGTLCSASLAAFRDALAHTPRSTVIYDRVRLFRGEVPIPVYRRFDRPPNILNTFLTKRAGLFPNETVNIEKDVYVWLFSQGTVPVFSLVYHACHPVTRTEPGAVSADFVDAIRQAVRQRFGVPVCIFLQGCSGDIRPNFSCKRLRALPRCRLNWRFKPQPAPADEIHADIAYTRAVATARLIAEAPAGKAEVRVHHRSLRLRGGGLAEAIELDLSRISRFCFLPFEVSHLYNRLGDLPESRRFLVSCAGHTLGYLPHPTQIPHGGYEVDSACAYMSLERRLELEDEL